MSSSFASSAFSASQYAHVSGKVKAVGLHPYLPLCAIADESSTITVFDIHTFVTYLKLPYPSSKSPNNNSISSSNMSINPNPNVTVASIQFFGIDTTTNTDASTAYKATTRPAKLDSSKPLPPHNLLAVTDTGLLHCEFTSPYCASPLSPPRQPKASVVQAKANLNMASPSQLSAVAVSEQIVAVATSSDVQYAS
mmetsp:Transcript_2438/g.4540  ORF Transcript_2438/g.4540 Transcript_2438/m.4540 type:complete len:195 (+) Transcript_2438:114-698(+)